MKVVDKNGNEIRAGDYLKFDNISHLHPVYLENGRLYFSGMSAYPIEWIDSEKTLIVKSVYE